MFKNRAHPFFHYTTVVIVDDNPDFLVNFSLRLEDDLAYRLFSSPQEALTYVNSSPESNSLLTRCLRNKSGFDQGENYVVLDVDVLQRELRNKSRFRESAVVIVDYDMPGVNGIEFCRLIRRPGVRKILLTGVADEKIAVQAFNDGVIDKFILKQDGESVAKINGYIREYQEQYFSEKGTFIKGALNGVTYGFLYLPGFLSLFASLCRARKVVEYYLTANPGGYLMLTQDGKALHLVVISEQDMRTHEEMIRDYNGPRELLQLVSDRRVIPNFWEHGEFYSPEVSDWEKYVFPCQETGDGERYYYCILESPDYLLGVDEDIYRYGDYLEELDAVPTSL